MKNQSYQYNITKSLSAIVRLLLFIFLLVVSYNSNAQTKSKKKINIDNAALWESGENIAAGASRLLDSVILSHENIIMKCDSAWLYASTNGVDAFGHVHIISNDTLNLWADFIHYDGNLGFAKARKNVRLNDPALTLYTDSLDFNTTEEIGYYDYNGKIVDSANVLTSVHGIYYSHTNEVHFREKVVLVNDDYTINTDTMIYNTQSEIVAFEGVTTIVGDSTNIYGTSGWFNTKTNELESDENATIRRNDTQIQADFLYYNDNNGEGYARNNVIINDYANQMIVAGQNAIYNDFSQYALVTDSAVWIQYYNNDSLFLHADTLYTIPDTTAEGQKLLITYHNVRFYRSDMQGVCDSLVYFTNDSTIQLFINPVIWSEQNQMSANFIELINNSEPPNEVHLNENSFIVQKNDSLHYNQIKGKNMIGWITGQELYQIDVNGNGQSIYYPVDENGYIKINKAESSKIILYLNENQIKRITFAGAPVGDMKPLPATVTNETRLDGFSWREDERPANKFDIFGDSTITKLPSTNINNKLPAINDTQIPNNKPKTNKRIENMLAPAK